MIATAPGKLILTGEYAVLDGAPAIVVAVDRRAVARRTPRSGPHDSPFLRAVARELAARHGHGHPAAIAAQEITVDSSAFYAGDQKLGLGSSAAVTVAATAAALDPVRLDKRRVFEIAVAAHATAQGERGARGSGADVAAAVWGGTLTYLAAHEDEPASIDRSQWPRQLALIPFFTGTSADTATLISQVEVARRANPHAVGVALDHISSASRLASGSLGTHWNTSDDVLLRGWRDAAAAIDELAAATGIGLVPACVTNARKAMEKFGGTAKTTGAGGGDVGVAVIPSAVDGTLARRLLIEAGCFPLQLTVDDTGVDTRPEPQ